MAPVSFEKLSTTKPRLGQKELVEFVKELDDHIARNYRNLPAGPVP